MHSVQPVYGCSRVGHLRKIRTSQSSNFKISISSHWNLQLKDEMKKTSPESIAEETAELKDWEEELDRLQKLLPIQVSRDRLKHTELPALEKQVKEQESAIPSFSAKAEEVDINTCDYKIKLNMCFRHRRCLASARNS